MNLNNYTKKELRYSLFAILTMVCSPINVFMIPIAIGSTSSFIMFAPTKISISSFLFMNECLRYEFGSSMSSIAEWLVLGVTTSAPVVGLTLLKSYLVGSFLGNCGTVCLFNWSVRLYKY